MLRAVRARLEGGEEGFTLVELLVVLLLMTVVGAIVGAGVFGGYGGTRRAQDRVYALTDLQKGQERITRELRAAYGMTSQGMTFPAVEVAEPYRVTVNVLRDGGRIRFTYYVDDESLRETREVFANVTDTSGTTYTDSAVAPFIPMITNEVNGVGAFSYFDHDGVELPQPVSDTSRINRISVRLERDLPEHDPITVETQANLRNSRE